ncbi:MAG: type III-B CRISPR module RAMP protein Cmr6 [Anaerolineae bacterium]|nr:type III-B CRISPR module RAMP protein Cmr6 [Anaerolineae bacterium]
MTVPARRDALESVPFWPQFAPNAGLWFDKYLAEQKKKEKQKNETKKEDPFVSHIQRTGKIEEPAVYKDFFTRWQEALEKAGAVLREAQVIGRLAAGLGGETVIETGLTLHRTYGVPYIPGSSLKGAARAYATANLDGDWAKDQRAFHTLFGGQQLGKGEKPEEKARVGIAVFHDALPIPGSFKIGNDVMTVHHPDYYQKESSPPADWDSPTPIPFPSVNGRFLIATYAPSAPEWAESAMAILRLALAERGVGGKTSSGYGRMQMDEKAVESPEAQAVSQFLEDLANLPESRVATELNRFVERWRQADANDQQKRQMAQAILDKVEAANRTKTSKEKAWYQELVRFVTNNGK